jgi:hypothetical protein
MFRGMYARLTSASSRWTGPGGPSQTWMSRASARLAGAVLLGALAVTAAAAPAAATASQGHQTRLSQLACARGWAWNGTNAHVGGGHTRAATAISAV